MPFSDPLEEAQRVLDASRTAEVHLSLTGGVAVALISPSARRAPLHREYADIDFVGDPKQVTRIEALFVALGYAPEHEFNSLHGEHRLFFDDHEHRREADVFLGAIQGCHTLELRDRIQVWPHTLAPADLLLSKLQVLHTNDKDYRDVIALLADLPVTDGDEGISLARVREVCCTDWGWWRTVTLVAERTLAIAERMATAGEVAPEAPSRLRQIMETIEHAPKSRRWRLRAKLGERVRWHEDPEELEHAHA